jgi:hypothetical protein
LSNILWKDLQTLSGIFIPKVKSAVRATSRKSAMDWVETDVIDRKNILRVITMALERKVFTNKQYSWLINMLYLVLYVFV